MNVPTEFLIAAVAAAVVAIAIKLVRARMAARRREPLHVHEALIRRAERHAEHSPFLRKVSLEFRANGHISDRQADAVAKALASAEAKSKS
jgi:hypothetical protein